MTVVNAMKFGENRGGMVADSQGSTRHRKYEHFDKVSSWTDGKGNSLLIGGSGYSSFLCELGAQLLSFLPKIDPFVTTHAARALSDMMTAKKREVIDRYLQTTYGIASAQALSGQNIGQHLLSAISDDYAGRTSSAQELFGNGFLLFGKDHTGSSLYAVDMQTGTYYLYPQHYASVGSGADASDHVLAQYFHHLKQDERQNVPFVDGMTALLRATNTSIDLNQGVGGVPMIAYTTADGKPIALSEDASKLASEIVRVHDGGFLNAGNTREALEELLGEKQDDRRLQKIVEEVAGIREPTTFDLEERLFWKHPRCKELMRYLRGYK